MCICRSTSISRREARRVADLPVAAIVVPACDKPCIHLLELVGHARPAESGTELPGLLGIALSQSRLGDQSPEVTGHRLRVARLELEPELALAEQFLVGREARGDGDDAAGERAHERARNRSDPLGREHEDVRPGQRIGLGHPLAVDELDPLAKSPAERRRHGQRPRRPDGRAPGRILGERAEHPQEQAQRTALLAGAEQQLYGIVRGVLPADLGAREDHPVVAGEVALKQIPGRAVARGAGIEAPEQEARQRARELGRQDPIGRRVEAPDVEAA